MIYEKKSVYIKICNNLLDMILTDFKENEKFTSTCEISKKFKVSISTAQKSISVLTGQGFLIKKRGVGMFVATGAKEKILVLKKDIFFKNLSELLKQAKKLNISQKALIELFENGFKTGKE